MRPRAGEPRPITSKALRPGDILFKHASDGAISQMIRRGQTPHFWRTVNRLLKGAPARTPVSGAIDAGRTVADIRDPGLTGGSMSAEEATDITHVAVALGADDVVEFDEGGASKWEIVARSGHGFVRGPMTLPSRMGKTYEVYGCTSESLWRKVADKAELVWDLTHASAGSGVQETTPLKASYGLTKMLKTALIGPRIERAKGPDVSLGDFEKTLEQWLSAADRKNAGGISGAMANANIQFFCSNFVLYCYLWAASEWQAEAGEIGGLDYVLGRKTSVSPVELYVRVRMAGQQFFRYQGTLRT